MSECPSTSKHIKRASFCVRARDIGSAEFQPSFCRRTTNPPGVRFRPNANV